MKFDPDIHHRRSIRLRGFDYSTAGAYFVTICTQQKEHVFGEIKGGRCELSLVGRMAEYWWLELPRHFVAVQLDEFVMMPNHIHAIVWLVGADRCVRPMGRPAHPAANGATGSKQLVARAPFSKIVQWYKTMSANEYIRGMREGRWPAVAGRLWQRNYYEHVIRDDNDLNRIRQYIIDNPANWNQDENNPICW
jgi:REP element-mobilizing transposase RayT